MIIDTTSWGWLQWFWLICVLCNVFWSGIHHGEYREQTKYNGVLSIFAAIIVITIFAFGGFFN